MGTACSFLGRVQIYWTLDPSRWVVAFCPPFSNHSPKAPSIFSVARSHPVSFAASLAFSLFSCIFPQPLRVSHFWQGIRTRAQLGDRRIFFPSPCRPLRDPGARRPRGGRVAAAAQRPGRQSAERPGSRGGNGPRFWECTGRGLIPLKETTENGLCCIFL